MKYFKKQIWRSRHNLKCYETEKNTRSYVGKCKHSRKRNKKLFQPKTTLHLPNLLQRNPAQQNLTQR